MGTTTSYAQSAQPLAVHNSYQPPVFTDAKRIEKIKATQAVIDQLYKEHATNNHFPGMVYGVVVDGQLLYTGTAGITDITTKTPVTTQTDFRIASMSKSFTAMAIMQLRDKGKLQLDEPAAKYIPELKKITYPTSDAPVITIRHLLNHMGGFPQDDPWADRQLAATDQELLDVVKRDPAFSSGPGLQYEYSNLGFALLGKIVANVSGKTYQQYITENIWKPLGMDHTYWEYTKVPAGQLAKGHRWINGAWRDEPLLHDGAYGAMGGVITTLEDFSKYMALHMSAWPARTAKESVVLKRSSLREMQQPGVVGALNAAYKYPSGRSCPTVAGYAFGLRWTKDCEGRVQVGHSGGLPGFGSNWTILPDYGVGVVCFANVTYAPTATLNIRVLDTLISLAQLKPRQLIASPVLKERKEQLAKLLPNWKGAEQSGLFSGNFFKDFPIDSLRKEASALFAKAGNIVRVGEIVPENQLRGSFIIEGTNTDIEVYFTLMPDNPPLIQDYRLRERSKK
ncbi:beta-lactamase [Flavisolibacter tropicus]|uniref:Beta-lactamase n=1 Tax=Flavisolibacter tropicus TaxID=1492898 RepID=A0A172U2K5_9BACT|nr:beta-lactamase [Flavisolibacter tropicus]